MEKIIVANLKMYMTYDDVKNFNINKNIIICPSNIFIPYFISKNYNICLQNISKYQLGSHTGSICYEQAKSLGINYVLIGHSEVRVNEKDNLINEKIILGLKNNFNIILCVGEINKHNDLEQIKTQLLTDLRGITDLSNIMIAYEPVWCIGTGDIPSIGEIKTKIDYIKTIIKKYFNIDVRILYGGSVNEKNILKLKNISTLDGFLIGEASLDTNKLKKIIENFE